MEWMYQVDENAELWMSDKFETKEQAIEAAKKQIEDEFLEVTKFQVGRIDYFLLYIDGDRIIDYLREQAYDECGEASDDFLSNLSKEQIQSLEERLNSVLRDWLKEVNETPSFGTIVDVEEITLGA